MKDQKGANINGGHFTHTHYILNIQEEYLCSSFLFTG